MRSRNKRESGLLRPGVLALALLVVALAATGPAVAGTSLRGELLERVTSEIFPTRLPRSQPAPITLRVGFASKAMNRPEVPELSQISLELSSRVAFRTEGLPSCPISRLSGYGNARRTCAHSLVGHGFVVTEISLPGKAPIRVDGHVLAFYNEEGLGTRSNPYILAQVITGGEEPLTYVLPFEIERRAAFAVATRLILRHMRTVLGKPIYGGAYQFRGIYGRISSFEITLHRLFRGHGKRESLVSADCPDPHPSITDPEEFPPVNVRLEYANGVGIQSSARWQHCEVAR